MIELIIGIVAGISLMLFISYVKKTKIQISWWKWLIVVSGFFYSVFTLEVIIALLKEGATKGAVVVGVVMGFGAILIGVVIFRFILFGSTKEES